MGKQEFDSIIIGFGKGGKTLAAFLNDKGEKVAVIEKSKEMYGGTCINIGCIPTKSLAHSSLKSSSVFQNPKEFYVNALEEKNNLVSFLRQANYNNLANKENVTVIDGVASFVSEDEIKITTQNGDTPIVKGKRIFINTGASPIIPDIKGVNSSKYVFTSTSIMNNKKLPKHLVIIGGGYIGLEFASIYSNFGSKVTILEGSKRFLPREDSDIAVEVKRVLKNKGLEIHLDVEVKSIEDVEHEASLIFADHQGKLNHLKTDAVLIAIGRKPNTGGLNLEAAGVKTTDRNFVKVNNQLKTSNPTIWAIGDVNGGPQFTYISLDDYRIIRDQLYGENRRTTEDRKNVPFSVFINPPLSRVGMTEEEALENGYKIKVNKILAKASTRAQQVHETEGILKVIVDENTNKILGSTLFCYNSSEIINIIKLAMDSNLDYTVLRDNIYTHPSMADTFNDLFSL